MMTGREIVEAILAGERPDYLPVLKVGPWGETLERWRREGLGPDADHNEALGLCGLRTECFHYLPLHFNMEPEFPIRVLARDEEYVTLVDEFGVTKKMMRADFDRAGGKMSAAGLMSSQSHWIDFPVKNLRDWKTIYAERFRSELPGRVPADWEQRQKKFKEEAKTRWVWMFGFPHFGIFGGIRELMGYENMVYAMADEPALIHAIAGDLTDFWIATYAKVLRDVPLDGVVFFEDICATKGPLVSPATFREFAGPYYRKVTGALRELGVKEFFCDTDGNAWELLPELLACGMTGLHPCEVGAGMDVAALRERYPALALHGGIDKRALAKTPAAIDAELDRCFRVAWSKGRYFPALDHLAPPDISWANMQHYAHRYVQHCGSPQS